MNSQVRVLRTRALPILGSGPARLPSIPLCLSYALTGPGAAQGTDCKSNLRTMHLDSHALVDKDRLQQDTPLTPGTEGPSVVHVCTIVCVCEFKVHKDRIEAGACYR